MIAIRIALSILLLPAFVLMVRGVGSRSKALRGMFLILGVGISGLIINFPGLLDRSARELGINSGTDLVIYLLVVGLLTLTGYMIGKFRRIERKMSILVHELAVTISKHDSGREPKN